MNTASFLALMLALLFATTGSAYAKRRSILFGSTEFIHEIAPVELKGPQDESLVLAFKTTTTFVTILGLHVSDDGYVLALSGDTGRYYMLLAGYGRLQRMGLLPSPLPPYKVSLIQKLLGYSFWWILGVAGAVKAGVVIRRMLVSPRRPNPLYDPA